MKITIYLSKKINNSHQHHTLGIKTHPPSGLLIPWTSWLQPCSDLPQVEFPAHNMLVYIPLPSKLNALNLPPCLVSHPHPSATSQQVPECIPSQSHPPRVPSPLSFPLHSLHVGSSSLMLLKVFIPVTFTTISACCWSYLAGRWHLLRTLS